MDSRFRGKKRCVEGEGRRVEGSCAKVSIDGEGKMDSRFRGNDGCGLRGKGEELRAVVQRSSRERGARLLCRGGGRSGSRLCT